jgi:hypothetical protein
MSFKRVVLASEDTLHSVVANKGKFFAVITKSVQDSGFSRKAVTLVEIEEVVEPIISTGGNGGTTLPKAKP